MNNILDNKTNNVIVSEIEETERPTSKASYDIVYRYALSFCKGDATKATSFCRGWFSVGRDDSTNDKLLNTNKEGTQNDKPKSSSIKRKPRVTKTKQE